MKRVPIDKNMGLLYRNKTKTIIPNKTFKWKSWYHLKRIYACEIVKWCASALALEHWIEQSDDMRESLSAGQPSNDRHIIYYSSRRLFKQSLDSI